LPESSGDIPKLPGPPPGQVSVQPLNQAQVSTPPDSVLPQLPELEPIN